VIVNTKTNEIPVTQRLFAGLNFHDRFVSLDALHTQTQTARDIVFGSGGDYLLSFKED